MIELSVRDDDGEWVVAVVRDGKARDAVIRLFYPDDIWRRYLGEFP